MKCPHFDCCNAPLCPLDPAMESRVFLRDEPICFYMREAVKPLGQLKIRGDIGGKTTNLVGEAVEWAFLTHNPLRRRLLKASQTPSRMVGGGRGER